MIVGQQVRRLAVAGLEGARSDQAFQTVAVVGASAWEGVRKGGVARVVARDADVAHLRVRLPVQKLPVDERASAHSRPYRYVQERMQSLGCAPAEFTQRGSVDVRIEGYGHSERIANRSCDVEIFPPRLGRSSDVTESGRVGIRIDRSERADADGVEGHAGAEELDSLVYGFFGRGSGKLDRVQVIGTGSGGADELGSSGFDGAEPRHGISLRRNRPLFGGFSADRMSEMMTRLALLAWSAGVLAICTPVFAQQTSERFWLAGRYDGNRVVVYFNKVHFNGTIPSTARKIAPPVAMFFPPVELPASYVAGFLKQPGAEQFAIGDHYDLIPGNGTVATITLTTLVGSESDEEVGNDSFLGALATVEQPDFLYETSGFYAVRRYQEPSGDPRRPKTTADYRKHAGLVDVPVRLDVETEMASLLDQRMKMEVTEAEQRLAGGVAPALKVQPFQVADGSLRYYVRATWKSGKETALQHPYALAAWMVARPKLRVLAEEKLTTGYGDFGVPNLLNVVDLGDGRTGVIVNVPRDDSYVIKLVRYRDGTSIQRMQIFQSLGVGE